MWTIRIEMLSGCWLSMAAIALSIFMSRVVSSTSSGMSSAKLFSTLLMASSVPSFWSLLSVFFVAVCLSRIKFTVSCFLNFFKAFVGHLSHLMWLVSLSPSDWLLCNQDSLLFCWYSSRGVVSSVSQYRKKRS